jgi:hypothetical protein
MIVILGWATVLLVLFLFALSSLSEYVKRIDKEILAMHRTPVRPDPTQGSFSKNGSTRQ